MREIEGVSGQTLKHGFEQFTIGPPPGFRVWPETHGNVLIQKHMRGIFFIVAPVDTVKKGQTLKHGFDRL